MLNYIWAAMIVLGILFGAMNGNMKEITEAALESAGEAVSLCITMAGTMALWVGLMEVAESSGLIRKLTHMLSPFVSFMFPGIPKGHKARDYISTNMIANILGLGWACTPAGLKAMEELANLEAERGNPAYLPERKDRAESRGVHNKKDTGGTLIESDGKMRIASNEMCTFLIINISSLQLIPVNMIAYRQQYGSVNPAGIIAPAIVATCISTLVAVVYCKMKDRGIKYR
ncbi:MAG: nucleoside recognition protein [Lachnospiraceae bacterium]|nr:nucleoside recognition protein [Lachnospiraceae bacterium]